jgi:hypothetical protein
MPDADLYMSLAGIAGVFVGFGALIAVRSGGASEPQEVSAVRVVVAMGVMTIIGTLAPVTLGRYDLTDHQILALSSVLILVGSFGLGFLHIRTPEYKAMVASRSGRLRIVEVVEFAAWVLLVGGAALAPIVIVLGVAPELEAALYFTVLVLILLLAAWSLMSLVFMQRRPQTASGPAALPATGGSNA